MAHEPSVPKEPPYLPRLASPRDRPPAKGEEYALKREFLGEEGWRLFRTRSWIDYCQYWWLAYTDDISCGVSDQITYAYKIGASETAMSEIAGTLKVGVGKLSAELSSKLSTSLTLSVEASHTRTVNVPTDKCMGASIASWQRVNKCVVTQETTRFGRPQRPKISTLESWGRDFYEDVLHYRKEECCDKGGSQTPFLLDFPGTRIVTFGNYLDGTVTGPSLRGGDPYNIVERIYGHTQVEVELDGVRGAYRLGDPIPVSALDDHLARLVPLYENSESLTFGTLQEYTGPTEHILLDPQDRAIMRLEREVMGWLRQLDQSSLEELVEVYEGVDVSALTSQLKQIDSLAEMGDLVDDIGEDVIGALIDAGIRRFDSLRMRSIPGIIEFETASADFEET